jgi:curved DNA-binding protein CbpA
VKNYYQLLEIERDASAEEVRHAFRRAIARYHPDKVQHLGKELQELAAVRAGELTEAYRTLRDPERRAEYDRLLRSVGDETGGPAAAVAAKGTAARQAGARPETADRKAAGEHRAAGGTAFGPERASRDELVRRAVMTRFREAVDSAFGPVDERVASGFEVSAITRTKRLGRSLPSHRLLARFVPRIDSRSIREAWVLATRSSVGDKADPCVFLLGGEVGSARELAEAISEQRQHAARLGVRKLVLVPIDVRDWQALVPHDAPPLVRRLVAHLRGSLP